MALWGLISLSLHCWVCLRWTVAAAAAATTSLPSDKPGGPLDWLLSDKGPFHHSPEYIDFVEKNRQGFSTRYKIYRGGFHVHNSGECHATGGNFGFVSVNDAGGVAVVLPLFDEERSAAW
ncbi:BMP/retinoic acid-inducible neural-specific protein 3 DBCCR1-like protein 1 [Takifugu flavidus]|uniref:BMP/retinoic acid-inducible neural-specific protein 3 DBCCR1-like protein 1 n=1 Tax=Takifugu flavidus TaxID=433684 RepID=A0A5C6MY29_9TELE|nr:BMP/retinoic acid-inducible neural-specific protein 3 DBCCR1-like protein 1 [Takifugu flavidus]